MTARSETPLFGLPGEPEHESVLLTCDIASGLKTIIAIHSTARGPAFGGCRLWHYDDDAAAMLDALRLSQGMSLKNALADLPFGGGKAVIVKPREPFDRRALFCAFGDAVQAAGGRYITAEDVGSSTDDMRLVQSRTPCVSGIPRDGAFGGDPSPKTAWGVFLAIQQALQQHLKRPVSGSTVALQGLGAVGMALAEYLADAGAKLLVADIDAARTAQAVVHLGAQVAGVDEILAMPCDVLAPCALGAVLNTDTVPLVRAAIICGAANNQLATSTDGDALAQRGVLYMPDFLVNAGGIVSVAREYLGCGDETAVMHEVSRIAGRVAELLERSASGASAPHRVAQAWAREKLRS